MAFFLPAIVLPSLAMKHLFIAIVGIMSAWLLNGCTDTPSGQHHPFDDQEMRTIAQHADDRNLAALLPYLQNPNTTYAAYAAQCLGSFGDAIPITALLPLALHKDSLLSHSAAWSIGQKGDSTACQSIITAYSENPDNGALLTALARSMPVAASDLQASCIAFLQSVELNAPQRTMAFSDAMYHLHYRTIFDAPLFDKLMQSHMPANDLWLRKAQAIGRYRSVLREEYHPILTGYLDRHIHPDLALALIPAMLQVDDTTATTYIHNKLLSDSMDTRVELMYSNVLLRKSQMDENIVIDLLDMGKEHIQRTVLQQIIRQPISENLQNYIVSAAFENPELMAYGKFYQVQQGTMSMSAFLGEYHAIPEGYARISWIPILGQLPNATSPLFEELRTTSHLALRYALTEEWLSVLSKSDYAQFDESEFQTIWEIGDLGLNALMSEHLVQVELTEEQKTNWAGKMRDYMVQLELPQEIETYEMLRKAAETLLPLGTTPPTALSSYKLNWALIQKIPTYAQIRISTSQGPMVMALDIASAPGSVSHFVELIQQGFYTNKYFHRMVPNFVVQGGCPRGDGMGSTPNTLRSEFAPHSYATGTVGLASSGRDTESCQWFVSLLPTPHLDGRYTILGKVTDGMEVAQRLKVGDQILGIELLNFSAN